MAGAEEVGLLEEAPSLSAALSARTATLEQELVLSPAFVATAAKTPAEAAAQPLVRRALYASHFLSTWGQRGWEFSIGLIMLKVRRCRRFCSFTSAVVADATATRHPSPPTHPMQVHPTSLLLVSVFGLLDAAVSVVFGASVGQWVDRTDRLLAAQRMYLLQNSEV